MNKTILKVPGNIRFISDWKEFGLENFPYILDKQLPGCGFTEWCLTNAENLILCSPRVILLENKAAQHPGELYYFKNKFEVITEVDKDLVKMPRHSINKTLPAVSHEEWIQQYQALENDIGIYCQERSQHNLPFKLIVTYDSFSLLKSMLENMGIFDIFRVVVDEMQSIFVDSKFKSDTELKFVEALKGMDKVCYVSATPMLEEYLDRIDYFKDLPYYEFDWVSLNPVRVCKPALTVKSSRGVIESAREIIDAYKAGRYDIKYTRDEFGNIKSVPSTEAVIYVNSVNNIINIIKRFGLEATEVNILCSKTDDNIKKIRRRLGVKYSIGTVPLKGDPRKMFTFCTRTVYLGADFYSPCAKTFVISDANIDTLAVDISLDLPQILGRQRLQDNPWKDEATFYYHPIAEGKKLSKDEFDAVIKYKLGKTNSIINACALVNSGSVQDRDALYDKLERSVKNENYKNDYFTFKVNPRTKSRKPIVNNLVLVAEQRAYDIQQIDFKDRFSVFTTIDNKFNLTSDNFKIAKKFVEEYEQLGSLHDKLKYLYDIYEAGMMMPEMINQLTEKNFREYINVLGWDRIKANSFNTTRLEEELRLADINGYGYDRDTLVNEIYGSFIPGEIYTRKYIKDKLKDIYSRTDYKQTAKSTDIKDWFDVENVMKDRKYKAFKIIKRL